MPRLTLLLPATSRFAGIALPQVLARALGRADRGVHDAGEDAQLARHFQLVPNRWAHAALTRVVDGGIEDASLSGWLRADPAYIRPDINGARLLAIGDSLEHDVAGAAGAGIDAAFIAGGIHRGDLHWSEVGEVDPESCRRLFAREGCTPQFALPRFQWA